jgi:hypothetical protein
MQSFLPISRSLPGQHSPNEGSQISPGGRQLGGSWQSFTPVPESRHFEVQQSASAEQSSPIGRQPPS